MVGSIKVCLIFATPIFVVFYHLFKLFPIHSWPSTKMADATHICFIANMNLGFTSSNWNPFRHLSGQTVSLYASDLGIEEHWLTIRVSPKKQKCFVLPHLLHVAAFIPKKVKPKEIRSFQTFVLRRHAFSFYKGNSKNIQRKICMRTVLALISHIMVQSISNLDQIATFAKTLL